jgi:multimeric flavodoxin WrbA
MQENQRKVIGIVGSPRRDGNTECLVDEVLNGAQKEGAQIKKVILNELHINPCQACGGCHKTGQCVQKDDMKHLLQEMETSTTWVLGTPVYWWGPSGQFKIFIDRWYGVKRALFSGRQVILIIPLGGSESYARHTVGMLSDILDYLDMELQATILAPGVQKAGEVRIDDTLLATAHRVGREAV